MDTFKAGISHATNTPTGPLASLDYLIKYIYYAKNRSVIGDTSPQSWQRVITLLQVEG